MLVHDFARLCVCLSSAGQEWYIENVLEELDDANEWYYDHRSGQLYFAFNGTQPTDEEWIATRTKVLFNVSGTAANPAKDITISGIQIRDTALTWLDPHGLPSGGDWVSGKSAPWSNQLVMHLDMHGPDDADGHLQWPGPSLLAVAGVAYDAGLARPNRAPCFEPAVSGGTTLCWRAPQC